MVRKHNVEVTDIFSVVFGKCGHFLLEQSCDKRVFCLQCKTYIDKETIKEIEVFKQDFNNNESAKIGHIAGKLLLFILKETKELRVVYTNLNIGYCFMCELSEKTYITTPNSFSLTKQISWLAYNVFLLMTLDHKKEEEKIREVLNGL